MARKILLADDSVTAQNMGRKILADAGYEVIAVNNGSAALKKIAELKPDLVVLDVYMPGYSGLEVCQRLKESPDTSRIPVLLTVGKLEPFKPEEAQRVRAEAFIVKPFEASELLSALSKLEDKVVPRSESSRPGRFARAFAAVEESDRVRPGEENGWKSRINFPHKKTQEEEKAESSDQPSTYNPINRDLRTIVETPQEKAEELAQQEEHHDVKGYEAKDEAKDKDEEKRESSGHDSETVDVAALTPSGVPPSGLPKDVTQEELAAITAAAAQIQAATAAIEEEQRASEAENAAGTEPALGTAEAAKTVGFEPPMREIDLDAAAPPIVEPPAAMSENKTAEAQDSHAADSQDSREAHDVPVTMAATADSVASSAGASRWTAVAVALEGDEAGLLLEHEMQKASAASQVNSPDSIAAAEAVAEFPTRSNELDVQAAGPAASREFSNKPDPAPVAAVPSMESVRPPASQTDVTATMASSVDEEQLVAGQRTDSIGSESAPVQPAEMDYAAPSAQDVSEAAAETNPAEESVEASEAIASEFATQQSAASDSSPAVPELEAAPGYSMAAQEAQPEPVEETTEAASGYRAFHTEESAGESAGEPEIQRESEAQTQLSPENETVKSRAAAWASWRQIRDADKTAEPARDRSEEFNAEPSMRELSAAAAAAGAEHTLASSPKPEEHGNSEVASIVDSVLADLRPKLMQEISRKMAEKK